MAETVQLTVSGTLFNLTVVRIAWPPAPAESPKHTKLAAADIPQPLTPTHAVHRDCSDRKMLRRKRSGIGRKKADDQAHGKCRFRTRQRRTSESGRLNFAATKKPSAAGT